MLIRLMEEFGVKISSFEHVLEGHKVADEIAKHGAGASTFSDWWAYKCGQSSAAFPTAPAYRNHIRRHLSGVLPHHHSPLTQPHSFARG